MRSRALNHERKQMELSYYKVVYYMEYSFGHLALLKGVVLEAKEDPI